MFRNRFLLVLLLPFLLSFVANSEEVDPYADVSAPKYLDNVVAIASPTLWNQLKGVYAGTSNIYDFLDLAANAFVNRTQGKDVFDFVIITPYKRLLSEGGAQQGVPQFVSTTTIGKLRGMINMPMYKTTTTGIALMHEIAHSWGVHLSASVMPGNQFPSHWGFTGLDRRGLLGGFPKSAVSCEDGTSPSKASPCATSVMKFRKDAGSLQTGVDGTGPYSDYELHFMGLKDPTEEIVYCASPVDQTPSSDSSDWVIKCSQILYLSPSEVKGGVSPAVTANQISPNTVLKVGSMVVYPDTQTIPTSVDTDPQLEWWSDYLKAFPEKFKTATQDLAEVQFVTGEVTGEVKDDELQPGNIISAATTFHGPPLMTGLILWGTIFGILMA